MQYMFHLYLFNNAVFIQTSNFVMDKRRARFLIYDIFRAQKMSAV